MGAADEEGGEAKAKAAETYEIMNLPPSKYLCSIPVVAPPAAPNQTAAELAKAEEARELSLASTRGWELLRDLDGTCLYFISGWWSYMFCYGDEIVQFHALPSGPKGGPPVRDPQSHEYVLGRVHDDEHHYFHRGDADADNNHQVQGRGGGDARALDRPPNTELQVKGDQRYLMQRLEGGTICDLTGRERTVEVQYHCQPGLSTDHIGWIKEVTTCTYLMVVYTPRLCQDLAFLPPKETRANTIACRLIVSTPTEERAFLKMKMLEAQEILVKAGGEDTKAKGAEAGKDAGAAAAPQTDGQGVAAGDAAPPPVPKKDVPATQPQTPPRPRRERITIGGVEVGARRVMGGEGGTPDGQRPAGLRGPGGRFGTGFAPDNRRDRGARTDAGRGAAAAAGQGQGGDSDDAWAAHPDEKVDVIAQGHRVEPGEAPAQHLQQQQQRVVALDEEELRKLDLDPELVEELKQELQRMAGDRGWKLEVVEVPGEDGADGAPVREIRGTVDAEDDDGEMDGAAATAAGGSKGGGDKAEPDAQQQQQAGSQEQFFAAAEL